MNNLKRLAGLNAFASSDTPNYRRFTNALESIGDELDKIANKLESKQMIDMYDEFDLDLGEKYKDTTGENLGDSIYAVQQTLREAAEALHTIAFDATEEARMEYSDY